MGGGAPPLLNQDDDAASDAWEELLRRDPPQTASGALPCGDVVRLAGWEWRNLWRLSWASVVIQVSVLLLGTIGQMFAGHLGTLELAGVAVTGMSVQAIAFGVSVGTASAVQTICGQAYGARRYKTMGVALQQALTLHLIFAIILALLFCYSGSLLRLIGQPDDIALMGQSYARGLIPHVIAISIYAPLQRFLQAQNVVNPVACISLLVLAFHVLMMWLTVSVFQWGLWGVSISFSVSCCLLTLLTWLYIVVYSPQCKQIWTGFSLEGFRGLWSYTKLAFASGIMLALEIWYVPGISLLTGYLKNPEISLDAMSICSNLWNWDFMIMFGLSNAASARIGKELGAGHPRVARFAVIIVLTTTIVMSPVISLLLLLFNTPICKFFTESNDVILEVRNLSPILAISVILNGVQPILSGVAVGCGWQDIVAYVNVISYYLVGLPIAYFLGFKTSLQVAGLFWGVVIGILVQTLVLTIITLRIDWNKEVDKALQRLKNTTVEDDYLPLANNTE